MEEDKVEEQEQGNNEEEDGEIDINKATYEDSW